MLVMSNVLLAPADSAGTRDLDRKTTRPSSVKADLVIDESKPLYDTQSIVLRNLRLAGQRSWGPAPKN
jgi:hypothetical protein